MTNNADISDLIGRVETADLGTQMQEHGKVVSIADGLARVSGLPSAGLNEILEFSGGVRGFVLSLDETELQAAFLDPSDHISAGDTVLRSGAVMSVPVGDALLGRVVDPLGRPLDTAAVPECGDHLPIERMAPAIIERDFVSRPLETGILVVDALFAVGRGQRELIIGERQTGKTSIALDAILNQRSGDVLCVYVAIGQRSTAVARVVDTLRNHDALEHTIVVVAEPSGEPGLRWIAPFAATSMAEAFRDQGRDVLIVYDDLTKHAAVHRELALLSHQPPGREAYPGDIFYLHARLLERSGQTAKGGSITALPIAEIEAGNLSAYIPTNLISISDGQIVTSAALFAANQRPAIDVGLSVSRVGGKAQPKAMKSVAGRLRLDYAQYLEMKMFARFGGFGDDAQSARMVRGERIAALLAQGRFHPLPLAAQIAMLAALDAGVLDDLTAEKIAALKPQIVASFQADPFFDPEKGDFSQTARDACVALVSKLAAGL